MSPDDFLNKILDPGVQFLESIGGPPVSNNARRMLLAIALQESGQQLDARYQNSPSNVPGPARGWWQFEQNGGVLGVLTHNASRDLAVKCCREFSVQSASAAVWRALEGHDMLAACFARLLLWTDPQALPTEQQPAWDCYMRVWRPGIPHRQRWPENWDTASTQVGGA